MEEPLPPDKYTLFYENLTFSHICQTPREETEHVFTLRNIPDTDRTKRTSMKNAMAAGVNLVACSMSMDIMGIKKEELIDGIEIRGVATYLGDAELGQLCLASKKYTIWR